MSILFETNKFHHGGLPCSGGPGQLPPLPPPLIRPWLGPRINLTLLTQAGIFSVLSIIVVCLRGGEKGICLGPPFFGGPPLRCYAH